MTPKLKHLVVFAAGLAGLCGGIALAAFTPIVNPDPQFCNNPVYSSVLLSDAGAPTFVPFASQSGRRAIQVCNSAENAGTPIVKCGIVNTPTFHDAGILLVDGGVVQVPGVCYVDGGPSCGSTYTWVVGVDSGYVLLDAGCGLFDAGTFLQDGGPGCFTPNVDGGLVDGGPCLVDAGSSCKPAWTNTTTKNPLQDGGQTFHDGGPCLADSGFCWLDGGIVTLDAGPQVTDSGFVFGDGGPFLGSNFPGDALKVGDCITYPVGSGTQVICTGTQGTAPSAATTECQ